MILLASLYEERLVRKTPMAHSARPAGREHRSARGTAIFGETTNWSNQTSNIPH
jgi:hypothetical protein